MCRYKGLTGRLPFYVQLLCVMMLIGSNIVFYGFNYAFIQTATESLFENAHVADYLVNTRDLYEEQGAMAIMLTINVS